MRSFIFGALLLILVSLLFFPAKKAYASCTHYLGCNAFGCTLSGTSGTCNSGEAITCIAIDGTCTDNSGGCTSIYPCGTVGGGGSSSGGSSSGGSSGGPTPPPPPAACTIQVNVSCPPPNVSGGGGCCSPNSCVGGICRPPCFGENQTCWAAAGAIGNCCSPNRCAVNGTCKLCTTVGPPPNLSPNGSIVRPGPVTLSWGAAWGANGGYSLAVGFPVYGYVAGARSATIDVPESWMGSTIGWSVSAANACGTSSNSSSATFTVCKANGATCSGGGSACCSGLCMGGRCGGVVVTPTPPCSGPPKDIGESCGGSGACCASGHCSSTSGGTCCKPDGQTCGGSGAACCSGICENGTCGGQPTPTPTPACPGGLKVDGMPCGGSGACCVSGSCIPQGRCGGSSTCKVGGESCGGSGAACCSGSCVADGSGSCSGAAGCRGGGESCGGSGAACCSGSCSGGQCTGASNCRGGGESCGGSGAACCSGSCVADGSGSCSGSSTCKVGGETCGGSGAACCSGSCTFDGSGVCGTGPTQPPVTNTPTPQPPGYTPPPVTNTPTPTNNAWIQLRDASFQGSGLASNPMPSGNAFITNEKGIIAGYIDLGDGDAGGARINTDSISVDTETYPQQASARKRPTTITNATDVDGNAEIYIANTPGLTINPSSFTADPGDSFVVISKGGTVEINSNYNASGGAKLIIADEINIDSSVTQIDAILVANIIKFGGGSSHLTINGNLAVNGIEDARVGTPSTSGVSVNVKPQMYLDLLPQLSVIKVNWKKVN